MIRLERGERDMYHYSYGHYQWRHPAHGARQYWTQVPQQGPWQGQSYIRQEAQSTDLRRDYGPNPYVVDIEEAAERNNYFRSALWTGNHLQVTLMSIPVRQDIGIERHTNVDQFLRIENGVGLVQMGSSPERLDFQRRVEDGDAIMIPAGTWHNVINVGDKPLKLYSIYAPPEHPHGTVHRTKEEAMAAEQAMQRMTAR
ncbi:cupin domain-containing protein [Insulibacter thermoxylanivorax]|nr:cupin domain-containing protein [Insulibacter thermoxylanivorax]